MERLTSYERDYKREMVCRYEECDTCEEYCPYLNVDNCPCLQDVLKELAEYKDLDGQGRLLIVPKIKKNKTLYWIWGNEIMPVLFKRITGCAVDNKGNPHILCEMEIKKDRTFVHTYKRKPVKNTFKAGDKRYFYPEDIGKSIFYTKEEAETALKKLEEGEENGKGSIIQGKAYPQAAAELAP